MPEAEPDVLLLNILEQPLLKRPPVKPHHQLRREPVHDDSVLERPWYHPKLRVIWLGVLKHLQ